MLRGGRASLKLRRGAWHGLVTALLALLPQQGLLGMHEDDVRPRGMKAR